MSNAALRNAVAPAKDEAENVAFPQLLYRFKNQIEHALPKHLNADRMARIALTCYRQTPKLAYCKPASVFAAVIQAAQLGLEPGLNGRAFLIPYGDECQFVPGWKGLLELVNRTGRAVAWTGAVFSGDHFEFQLGDSPFAKHIPAGEDDPLKLTHTYAVGRIRGNDFPIIEAWPIDKIWRHRDRYNKVGKKHYSFLNPEMYARKVPLLQVIKYLPSSPELEQAIALNDAAELGTQGLTLEGALANTYEPPKDDDAGGVETTGAGAGSMGSSGGGGPSYADIAGKFNAAKDGDGYNEAIDLFMSWKKTHQDDKKQADEIEALALQARDRIAAAK